MTSWYVISFPYHIDIFLTHFNDSYWTGRTSFDFKHPLVRHPLWRLDHHWHRSQYLPGRFPGDSSDCAMPWLASQRHDRVERCVVRCHQNLGERSMKIHPREIREVKPWERQGNKKTKVPSPTSTYCKFGIGTFFCGPTGADWSQNKSWDLLG